MNRIGLDGERFPPESDRITVVPADVITPNGMTAAPDGTLVLCDQGDLTHEARLTRLNPCTGATAAGVDTSAHCTCPRTLTTSPGAMPTAADATSPR